MPEEPYTPADFNAVKTLIAHQRRDIGSCTCGWGVDTGDLGRSHSLHVWRVLQAEVLPDHDARVRAQVAEEIANALEPLIDLSESASDPAVLRERRICVATARAHATTEEDTDAT